MATVQTRIGPADHGRRMTLAEFLDAEETPGYRYELARGIIGASNIASDPHAQIIDHLHEEFGDYRRHNPGRILRISHANEIQIVIPELETDRRPDLGIVFVGKALDERGHRVPDLVVDVVSPGKAARDRDVVAKREDYLTFGTREYWIVNRFERKVTILARHEGGDGPSWIEHVFGDGQAIASPLLPGFALLVDALWADMGDEEEA